MSTEKKEKLLAIKLTKSVKLGKDWKMPGDIVEIPVLEANRLIRLKCATDNFSTVPAETGGDQTGSDGGGEGKSELELISSIEGVSDKVAALLVAAGFNTIQKVAEAEPKDLIAIKGIGKKTVEDIQDSAESLS